MVTTLRKVVWQGKGNGTTVRAVANEEGDLVFEDLTTNALLEETWYPARDTPAQFFRDAGAALFAQLPRS